MLDIGTKIRFKVNVNNEEYPELKLIFAKAGEFGEVVHTCEDGAPVAEVNDNGIWFAIKPEWVDICG